MYECIQTYIHIDTGIHTCMHTYAQTYKHEHAESVANYEVFVRCAQKAGGKRIRGVKEAQGLLIMGWHHAHLQRSASWARRKQKVCLSWAGTTHIISEAHHERERSRRFAYHGLAPRTSAAKRITGVKEAQGLLIMGSKTPFFQLSDLGPKRSSLLCTNSQNPSQFTMYSCAAQKRIRVSRIRGVFRILHKSQHIRRAPT